MTLRRVEAGILDYDMDINPGTTPFDAGLGYLVDFDNSAFVGRSALLEADRRATAVRIDLRDGQSAIRDGGGGRRS